jgi:hypothetical protein
VEGRAVGEQPVNLIEIIVNGEVVRKVRPRLERTKERAWESAFRDSIDLDRSGWIALRCWEEREGARVRFAHTAPTWIEVRNQAVRPRRPEAEWLVQRTRDELARSQGLLSPEAVADYQRALAFYEELLSAADAR